MSKFPYNKKKTSYITKNKIKYISYRDIELLSHFISPTNKILPARTTGLKPKQQRDVATKIKRARYMGFLKFTE